MIDISQIEELVSTLEIITDTLDNFVPKKLFQVQHRIAYNATSGTFAAGAWRNRPLNYVAYNNIDGAKLNTGNYYMTLPTGEYEVDGRSQAFYVNRNVGRLWNITDGVELFHGSHGLSHPENGYNDSGPQFRGRFTLTKETVFKLQQWGLTTYATHGFGYSGTADFSGFDKIFADFRFWKID